MINYNKFLWGAVALFIAAALVLPACSGGSLSSGKSDTEADQASAEKEILYYTCGMHPSVKVSVEDCEAGNDKCPICNMDLVPVYAEGKTPEEDPGSAEHGMDMPEIKLSARAQALAQVKTEEVGFRQLFKEVEAVGQLVWDERRLSYVAARVSGRLDALYVNFTGTRVSQGSPLALIYSPELLTTQEEFLLALETRDRIGKGPDSEAAENAQALVQAAKKRLLLWGISEKQVEELISSRKASTYMIIPAPIGGTVIHKNAFEGKYVKEGENL